MGGTFQITQGLAKVYVDLYITRDRDQGLIHLDQCRYLERVLRRFGHEDYHTVAVPSDPASVAQMRLANKDDPQVSFPYRECVGCLQFAHIGTRFNISYVVNNMSRFNNQLIAAHVSRVKEILKYIKGTLNHTITYGRGSRPNILTTHCNADYAADCDDRKSRSSFLLLLHSGPVAWGSHKQTCTSLSTTEFEYIAASLATQKTLWM